MYKKFKKNFLAFFVPSSNTFFSGFFVENLHEKRCKKKFTATGITTIIAAKNKGKYLISLLHLDIKNKQKDIYTYLVV